MSPLDEWCSPGDARTPGLRVWLKFAMFAGAFGILTGYAASRCDWSGVQRSRAELARATARAAAVQAVQVPTRVAAAFTPVPLADLLMQLTRMAEESGLRLRTLERVPAEKGRGSTTGHADGVAAPRFHLVVSGDFFAMRRWLSGWPSLPALVVPRAMEARRETHGGVLEVDLQLFPDLPGTVDVARLVKTAVAERFEPASPIVLREPAADPFGSFDAPTAAEPRLANWQLAGLLRDARHGLALFEQSGETRLLARGHALDTASLTSVEARGVLLALPDGAIRRIPLRAPAMP